MYAPATMAKRQRPKTDKWRENKMNGPSRDAETLNAQCR